MKIKIKLKRGYDVDVEILEIVKGGEDVYFLGSYSKSQYGQTSIVDPRGIAPTVTGNHGQVISIIEGIEDE